MLASGENQKEVIRPDFNRACMIDFLGASPLRERVRVRLIFNLIPASSN
jgi:hypothetical protein